MGAVGAAVRSRPGLRRDQRAKVGRAAIGRASGVGAGGAVVVTVVVEVVVVDVVGGAGSAAPMHAPRAVRVKGPSALVNRSPVGRAAGAPRAEGLFQSVGTVPA